MKEPARKSDSYEILGQIRSLLRTYPNGLSIRELSSCFNINRNSMAKYLEILRLSGMIDLRQSGKAKVYTLCDRVPFSAIMSLTTHRLAGFDHPGRLVDLSDSFSSFLGSPRERLVGCHFENLPHPLFQGPEFRGLLNSTLKGERISRKVPFVVENRPGVMIITAIPTVFVNGTKGAAIVLGDTRTRAAFL